MNLAAVLPPVASPASLPLPPQTTAVSPPFENQKSKIENPPRPPLISRLPRDLRNHLGSRLLAGQPASVILKWLNQSDDVVDFLNRDHAGHPLTEPDLAEWQAAAYPQWLADQQACDVARELAEQSAALSGAADENFVSDCLATLLATELARCAKSLLADAPTPADRWQRLQELLRSLSRLRHHDHQALHTQIQRERWQDHQDRLQIEDDARREKKRKNDALDLVLAKQSEPVLANAFGGGDKGALLAELINAIRHDLPLPQPLPPKRAPKRRSPHPGKSGQLRVNPGKSGEKNS